MKKLKLVLSLAMLIAIPTTNSFADTKTTFAPIVDASQMNMTAINGLKPVKIGGGGSFSPSIGSIFIWPYRDQDPSDSNCISVKQGGDGSGGTCKWLECNGQAINPSIYPEYFSIAKSLQVPDMTKRIPKGRSNTETAAEAYNHYEEFTHTFRATYSFETPPEGEIDGIVGFRTGKTKTELEGLSPPSSLDINTYSGIAPAEVKKTLPVRFLIRMSN